MSELWRKKSIVIEAWHFLGNYADAPDWVNPKWSLQQIVVIDNLEQRGDPFLLIPTLEGEMRANLGDWIIRGVQGEVYPCKPDIFEANYERVQFKPVAGEPKGDA